MLSPNYITRNKERSIGPLLGDHNLNHIISLNTLLRKGPRGLWKIIRKFACNPLRGGESIVLGDKLLDGRNQTMFFNKVYSITVTGIRDEKGGQGTDRYFN